MLLLGCGTTPSATSGNSIGTNLLEATSLRVHLSQHKVQIKYISINKSLKELNINDSEHEERNLFQESARITRGKDMFDIMKFKSESV